ncbi:MAG: toll/interleukin-1 receptor domain-containing protein, partial [Acidobacteriota bacterium]|nr:toll/interleukin-1 receptor domain-containing protein [Acidobacteriota bacterium]
VAEFNPFVAKLGSEEIVLGKPVARDGLLFSHRGGSNETVEIRVDRGVLSAQTRALLKGNRPAFVDSDQPQDISYTTQDLAGARGAPCRTSLDIHLDPPVAPEIHLFQDRPAGQEFHREIEITPQGGALRLDFQTAPDNLEHPNQPGCRKLLQIGNSGIPIMGLPIEIVAAAGSKTSLKFMSTGSGSPWRAADLWSGLEFIGLTAGRVQVNPIGSGELIRMVRPVSGPQAIDLRNIAIGSDTLQADIAGTGMVTVNGRLAGPTLGEWVTTSYPRCAAVMFLNFLVALGAWFLWRPVRVPIDFTPGAVNYSSASLSAPQGKGIVVFLCHCSEDKPAVRELRDRLQAEGFRPWLDERDIVPAHLWDEEIQKGLRASAAVVVCLSTTFARKAGFVQKELRYAVEIAEEQPDGATFLIPVRLEPCDVPARVRAWQYIDLFDGDLPESAAGGFQKLKLALDERTQQLSMTNPARAST